MNEKENTSITTQSIQITSQKNPITPSSKKKSTLKLNNIKTGKMIKTNIPISSSPKSNK